MSFTQSEIVVIVYFLTQQLNDIPTLPSSCFDSDGVETKIDVVEEYRFIFFS